MLEHNKKENTQTDKESGAALAITLIIVAILSVIALTALAFASSEARQAGSDLQRTQTFYATASAIEKMTNDFSNLFRYKMRPDQTDLDTIALNPPLALTSEGFTFDQSLTLDTERLTEIQRVQGLPANVYPRVNIPEGVFAGLYSTIIPYKISSTGNYPVGSAQVTLEREFNNYLIPLFQFGIFSNSDIELSPGVMMTFNGRVHSNENIFAMRNVKFLKRLTAAGEFVWNSTVDGATNNQSGYNNVWVESNSINVRVSQGSVKAGSGTVGGPNILGSTEGNRGYFPGRPNGIATSNWDTVSVLPPASGVANRFGGQVLTNSTGVLPLKLPLQLEGSSAAELIKRSLPTDNEIVSASRYHSKSQVRIIIGDEGAGNGTLNAAGIPAGKGVALSSLLPVVLDNGSALRRVSNLGTYIDSASILQEVTVSTTESAKTVRGVSSTSQSTPDGHYVPPGAGLKGKILIEVTRPDGATVDVTKEILSLGMTEGEPNGIVYLQRPLWAAYVQGSRDRAGNGFDLVSLTKNYQSIADGEISDPSSHFDSVRGFITAPVSLTQDEATVTRSAVPTEDWNQIYPINVYNIREGWVRSQMNENNIYERGMTNVVELNMSNLARWLDGIFDGNLLSGTAAVSANIKGDEGYVVYISDRRGDKVKDEFTSAGATFRSTNGNVDNEDIYGPNGTLDEGEDVIDFGWNPGGSTKKGSLQKDTTELPDIGEIWCIGTVSPCDQSFADKKARSDFALKWDNPHRYFRRSVRLFDGEKLSFTAAAGKLSSTKGITIATENMVYIWGNFNTSGVNSIPSGGSTLNNGGYLGPQVPSSIICDAIFPLSKTWFDGLSTSYPEGSSDPRNAAGTGYRVADDNLPSISQGTAVRAAVITGKNKSSMSAVPGRDDAGSRRDGGTNNFPRF